MRKNANELNNVPPEHPDISAQEYAPLPDEFNRTEWVEKPKGKEKSSIRKVMLYLASIGLVTLGIITPIIRVNPSEDAEAEATPTPVITSGPAAAVTPIATIRPTEAPVIVPSQEPTPAPTEAPTPEPTEEPTPEPTPTPRMTGQIHITVFSEVFDWSVDPYPSEIIADETLDAATFTGYRLPPLPEQKGYKAVGYVLTKYSGLAYLGLLYDGEEEPHPIGTVALGDTLTADDLEIVPKSIEDIYQAEIHVVWLSDEPNNFHLEFYDDSLFGDYYIGFPVYSEQLCYLAPFPVPEKEGKTFTGWCDADGHMVDAVTYFDFFPVIPPAESMEDRDWKNPIPCKVYACWSDGSGGAPEPTPTPTPTPTPKPTRRPTPKPTKKPTPTPNPTPLPTNPPPTPKMVTIKCSNCRYSTYAGSGASGNIQAGTYVTVTASGNTSSVGIFVFEPASASSMSGKQITGTWDSSASTYRFSVSFTIQSNTVVYFSFVVN